MSAIPHLALLAALAFLPAPSLAAPADDALDPEIEVVVAAAGEVLAINDLCQWDLAPKVEKALADGMKALKMPARQQQSIRAEVTKLRNARFANVAGSARARTVAELCTPQERAFLDKMIAQIAFE